MNILIKKTSVQFKSPIIGQPTKRTEEHFYKRNITAVIDGDTERIFSFMANELSLYATEEDMIVAIEDRLNEE